jgi:hypothetical protein
MPLTDLEAIKAIDRLAFAWSRNPDVIALRPWIAAHCGLNPHAAKPLDPDAPLLAERDKLRAAVAGLQDKLAAAAARLQDLESRNRELKDKLAGAKNEAKKERAERLQAGRDTSGRHCAERVGHGRRASAARAAIAAADLTAAGHQQKRRRVPRSIRTRSQTGCRSTSP